MDASKLTPFDYEHYSDDDLKSLQADILLKLDDWSIAKKPYDAQAILNIALYTGRQYMRWDTTTGRLMPVDKLYKGQMRVVINKVQPRCRAALARVVGKIPVADVLPNSSDHADELGARMGKALLNWNYNREDQKLSRVYRQVALWSIVTGTAWAKDVWDPTYGKQVPHETALEPVMEQAMEQATHPETGEPLTEPVLGDDGSQMMHPQTGEPLTQPKMIPSMEPQVDPATGAPMTHPETGQPMMQPVMQPSIDEMDPQGRPQMQEVVKSYRFEGKVKTSAVSCLQMLYDINYTDWNDVLDCAERNHVPVDWVRENIEGCEDVEPLASLGIDDAYHMMYKTMVEGPNYTGNNRKGCEVTEYWSKKTMRFPRGLHVVLVNKEIKVIEPMPGLEGDSLPYSCFPYIELMGSIRGQGIPEILLDVQMGYNRATALILENGTTTATNKYLKDKNTTLTELPNDQIGQIIEHEGPAPIPVPGMPIPQTLYSTRSALNLDFDDVSMIHAVSMGGTDVNINSMRQLALQTENDQQSNGPILEAFMAMVRGSARRILIYYQAFAPPDMVMKIRGAEGRTEFKSFKVADINGNTDVYFGDTSMANMSRSSRSGEMEALLQSPNIQFMEPSKRNAVLDMVLEHYMHGGENEQAVNEVTAQTKCAEDNCQMLAEGQPASLNPWYDFQTHLAVTTIRMLAPDFKTMDPKIQQAFLQYWTALQQEVQNEMAAKLAANTGVPPGPGSPTGPGAGNAGPGEPKPDNKAKAPGQPMAAGGLKPQGMG